MIRALPHQALARQLFTRAFETYDFFTYSVCYRTDAVCRRSLLYAIPVVSSGSNMKNKQKTAALSREFENFLSEMESMLQQTATLGGEELAEAKKRIQERMAEAKETVSDIRGDLTQR